MHLTEYNNHAVLEPVSVEQFAQFRDLFKLEYVTFRRFRGRTERTLKTFYYCFYNPKIFSMSFPIGAIQKVEQFMIDKRIEYKYRIHAASGCGKCIYHLPADIISNKYSFQEDAVAQVSQHRRGIFLHPTGSGKTTTMAKIIAKLQRPTLVVVPNLTLFTQTHDVFSKYFAPEPIGKLGDSVWNLERINIATQQTLWSIYEDSKFQTLRNMIDVLIIDECHHVNSQKGGQELGNSWFWVAAKIPAYFRYGMTATLGDKNSAELLKAVTGEVIHEIDVDTLVKRGVLTQARIEMHRILVHNSSYDWHEAFEALLNSTTRNQQIANLATFHCNQNKRVLIITNRIEKHGKILHQLIPNSVFVDGSASSEDRKDAIEDFKQNNHVLIGTIFGEGVDIPCVDVVIIANGGKSQKSVIQRLGRGLRTFAGKNEVLIIDFYDSDGALLERHSKQRYHTYKELFPNQVEVT
ncbi:DEAD/DEAH box helicase [candidate division WWE3 bacterium]|uniref:DEAD/DEAH box helicase n=1 Tax=candidate division WWE3 bacterium TaxID=2053526 RepID=A0A3A4ZEZ4_UNCKA|nr:MAG: DEAD/DEAH box helicase [candidate division WWE3 bacterium]